MQPLLNMRFFSKTKKVLLTSNYICCKTLVKHFLCRCHNCGYIYMLCTLSVFKKVSCSKIYNKSITVFIPIQKNN